MKPVVRFLPFLFSFIAALSLSCDVQQPSAPGPMPSLEKSAAGGNPNCRAGERDGRGGNTPLALSCVITVPGNPIASSDIAWVDRTTERYYVADRSNSGVDIIDAEHGVYVGRVGGMAGGFPTTPTTGGGTATSNGAGPNGVVVTPNGHLWAGDGNSIVQVADVDPDSPTYLKILASVNVALAACDGGTATTHYCGRADEIGYDPQHHVILIANPSPLAVAAPHAGVAPFATFISAVAPYKVLGHISFVGAGGLEQPLWNPENHRLYLTVPGKTGVTLASVAVINPTTMLVEKTFTFDCLALTGTAGVGITGIALGASQHLLVSACGFPIILQAQTGAIIRVLKQVGGGDEVWYNPGDRRFFVTGVDPAATPPAQALGVINAATSNWLQNVPIVRGKNPASFAENNHTFAIVQITAAIAAGTATDSTACAQAGSKRTGCIAVFTHTSKGDDDEHSGSGNNHEE
jgi:hypothetical protein